MVGFCFFFCKQKTAYGLRMSDWSSDVCSSDLRTLDAHDALIVFSRQKAQRKDDHSARVTEHAVDGQIGFAGVGGAEDGRHPAFREERHEIGSAACRERVCQYV